MDGPQGSAAQLRFLVASADEVINDQKETNYKTQFLLVQVKQGICLELHIWVVENVLFIYLWLLPLDLSPQLETAAFWSYWVEQIHQLCLNFSHHPEMVCFVLTLSSFWISYFRTCTQSRQVPNVEATIARRCHQMNVFVNPEASQPHAGRRLIHLHFFTPLALAWCSCLLIYGCRFPWGMHACPTSARRSGLVEALCLPACQISIHLYILFSFHLPVCQPLHSASWYGRIIHFHHHPVRGWWTICWHQRGRGPTILQLKCSLKRTEMTYHNLSGRQKSLWTLWNLDLCVNAFHTWYNNIQCIIEQMV